MPALFSLFTWRQYALGAFILLLAMLDPFGLSSSSNDASAQWLNRVFSGGYERNGQEKIAVILIDDAYLIRNNTHWPLPYGEQSKLFKRLLAYKPKAVFVDLLYSHDHSQDDPAQGSQLLANVFERYRHQGIPLLLANTGKSRGEDGQANTLASLAETTSPAAVVWSGFGNKYPLAVETTSLGIMETPAFALYREYCKGQVCASLPGDEHSALEQPPIAIQWGLNLATEQVRVADVAHCSTSSGFVLNALKQLGQAIFWKLDNPPQTLCPYNLTLSASDLEVTTAEDRKLLAELLRDRLVLVGAHITSTGDLVHSPVHGQIPGIYLHAMALDNLITKGMHYDREPESLGLEINILDVIEIALLALIAILKALHERNLALFRAPDSGVQQSAFFKSPIPSWILVITLLAALSYWLHLRNITPVNVLAVLMLSMVLFSEKLEAFFARKN